ncbi:hypothetical protein [Ruegeria denitrificans]|uniref:hypothetical protein n=1 Tax=Ruegeria denitrificans TaxID=1715692 RepID=UPI00103F0F3E|nr:hypothetical protein [Ruegeria denitrificans]
MPITTIDGFERSPNFADGMARQAYDSFSCLPANSPKMSLDPLSLNRRGLCSMVERSPAGRRYHRRDSFHIQNRILDNKRNQARNISLEKFPWSLD